MQQYSRRSFLRGTLLTPATILCAPALLKAASPAEKLSVGVIGCGIRGGFHAAEFTAHPDCLVSYVADADSARAESVANQVAESQGLRPQVETDLRRILDDTSVDCVSIATCNHWHALASVWALQAGKHVYVEKPLSWCIHEGRRVVQAARRYNRVCQVGTQYRSDPTILNAKRFIDDGGIGRVQMARSITYKRRLPIGPVVEGSPPATCDYHLWAGPAPLSPITRKQFHYDWHWFWETGNGDIGNNDVHYQDLCCWAANRTKLANASISFGGRFGYIDSAETPNTQIAIHDMDGVTLVAEIRGLPSPDFSIRGTAIIYGTNGIVVLGAGSSMLYDMDRRKERDFEGPPEDGNTLSRIHIGNFVDAVKVQDRKIQRADVDQGHISAGTCHLANNSYRLGAKVPAREVLARLQERNVAEDVLELFQRTVEHLASNGVDVDRQLLTAGPWLGFDPDQEQYIGRPDADMLLSRSYRPPFVVPEKESDL